MYQASAFQTQLEVVHALILRETRTRFGQHQLGYIWAMMEPVFWIVTFYGLFFFMGRVLPFGMNIVDFITTGVIPYLLFRQSLTQAMSAIPANKGLLFYPQIRPLDLVIARSCLEFATLVTGFFIIMGGLALYSGEFAVDQVLMVLFGFLLASLLGTTLGLYLSALSVFSNVINRLLPILMRPMFFISGLFFTANELPVQLRETLLWNPVLHTVEMVRHGWYPSYEAVHLDIPYVMYWILGFAYGGLIMERLARKRFDLT